MILRVNTWGDLPSMFCHSPTYLVRKPPSRQRMVWQSRGLRHEDIILSPYGEPRNPTPVINVV